MNFTIPIALIISQFILQVGENKAKCGELIDKKDQTNADPRRNNLTIFEFAY